MVPKLRPSGKSFKSLALYLLHDPNKAKTSERVGWTHTLNTAADSPALAVDEMLWTLRAAEELKREAGVKAGGRCLENPVKHFALNWHPSQKPTREHMIATVESFLSHMGWKDHQALIVNHTDKPHPHVHVMLNVVHPETGKVLDAGLERRRAQVWAESYDREHGLIFCEERLKPKQERDASPTRENWQRMKPSERAHDRAEVERMTKTPNYFARHDAKTMNGREWEALKAYQKQQRETFFMEGKQAFRAVRNEVFREVREEFRRHWKAFYAAKRHGDDPTALAATKASLLKAQQQKLDDARNKAFEALREARDETYKGILKQQQFDREELRTRQAQGLRTYAIMDLVYPEREPVAGKDRKSSENERQAPPSPQQEPSRMAWRAGSSVDGSDTGGNADARRVAGKQFERSVHRAVDPVDLRGRDERSSPGIVRYGDGAPSLADGFNRPLKEFAAAQQPPREAVEPAKPTRQPGVETTDAMAAKEPAQKGREMNEREEAKERKKVQEMVASWSRTARTRSRGGRD